MLHRHSVAPKDLLTCSSGYPRQPKQAPPPMLHGGAPASGASQAPASAAQWTPTSQHAGAQPQQPQYPQQSQPAQYPPHAQGGIVQAYPQQTFSQQTYPGYGGPGQYPHPWPEHDKRLPDSDSPSGRALERMMKQRQAVEKIDSAYRVGQNDMALTPYVGAGSETYSYPFLPLYLPERRCVGDFDLESIYEGADRPLLMRISHEDLAARLDMLIRKDLPHGPQEDDMQGLRWLDPRMWRFAGIRLQSIMTNSKGRLTVVCDTQPFFNTIHTVNAPKKEACAIIHRTGIDSIGLNGVDANNTYERSMLLIGHVPSKDIIWKNEVRTVRPEQEYVASELKYAISPTGMIRSTMKHALDSLAYTDYGDTRMIGPDGWIETKKEYIDRSFAYLVTHVGAEAPFQNLTDGIRFHIYPKKCGASCVPPNAHNWECRHCHDMPSASSDSRSKTASAPHPYVAFKVEADMVPGWKAPNTHAFDDDMCYHTNVPIPK